MGIGLNFICYGYSKIILYNIPQFFKKNVILEFKYNINLSCSNLQIVYGYCFSRDQINI